MTSVVSRAEYDSASIFFFFSDEIMFCKVDQQILGTLILHFLFISQQHGFSNL